MNTTRKSLIAILFLLTFFICATDVCLAEGILYCKKDQDCQPNCEDPNLGRCLKGRCWCFTPPSSSNKRSIQIP
ncbi:unnamed protein product [Lathyrus oleraceus]